MSGSLFDFGMYFFHSGPRLLNRGLAPFFYLPKLESHLEARLWNDVFYFAQDTVGLARGTIKATVLIETLPAAFEMDEILYELRDHSAGLNAGRWDYIFSAIKCFSDDPAKVLPDRADVTMTVPFMRAYAELLAATCHRRGAHAMGGMAALIPSRSDPEANEQALAGVRADKQREVGQGYDGTWVAHPDLVPTAREVFEEGLGGAPNQLSVAPSVRRVEAEQLLDLGATPGEITEAGLRANVAVGFQYVSFWLGGRGAAAINSLMEDAATAEISRTQLWQWVHHGVTLDRRADGHRRARAPGARRGDGQDPRRGRRGGVGGRAARRDPSGVRVGRADRAADRVPDAARVRAAGLIDSARLLASRPMSSAPTEPLSQRLAAVRRQLRLLSDYL